MSRDRSTHEFFEKFHQQFSDRSPWDSLKSEARIEARRTGVEFMCISEGEGRLLGQLGALVAQGKSQKWVEVGALTGFSALCLMESLPAGSELWTCELSPDRSQFLRKLFSNPEIKGCIHVVEGDSKLTLPKISDQGPFDGIFIDGAKGDYENNLEWADKNLKVGGYIFADNIFLNGDLFEKENKRSLSMQGFIRKLSNPAQYRSVLLPNKDGLWVAQLLTSHLVR